MKDVQTFIIVNPVAGNKRGRKAGEWIFGWLEKNSRTGIRLAWTTHPCHAGKLACEAIDYGAERIIAVGGDGTINEVVNGLFCEGEPTNRNFSLGLIDCGTGSGLAGTLRFPSSIGEQLNIALGNNEKWLDLGRISYVDAAGKTRSRYFISECQAGIGGKVASQTGPFLKRFGGTAGFGASALFYAMTMKAGEVSVKCDNKSVFNGPLIGLVIGNGSECAGGMKLLPGALTDDGRLDVLLIHEMKLAQRLSSLKNTYNGSHVNSPGFSLLRAERIEIETDHRWPVEVDGEVIGHSDKHPLRISLIPRLIKLYQPE